MEDDSDDDLPYVLDIRLPSPDIYEINVSVLSERASSVESPNHESLHDDLEAAGPVAKPLITLPLASVLLSSSVGLLAYTAVNSSAEQAFNWLVAATSVASLLSWAGMLFTYIRWYQGSIYAEKHNELGRTEREQKIMKQITMIKDNRHKGQPYLAWYAFSVCMLVLATSGWNVFLNSNWQIALVSETPLPFRNPNTYVPGPVSVFLSSYIPIPVFILLTLGYKLIKQTRFLQVEEMDFSGDGVERIQEEDEEPRNWWELFLRMIHLI